jgi:ADP-ribose pyrophosphatase YjhB (NUDIX family)
MPHPHLTVAVTCLKDDKVLMVNEVDNGIICWNQPAGHVEVHESIESAAIREALEETGFHVEILGLQGIYQGTHAQTNTHYVRICFRANAIELTDLAIDKDIIKAEWLPLADLINGKYILRSEITRLTLEDIASAPIVPMSFIHNINLGDIK